MYVHTYGFHGPLAYYFQLEDWQFQKTSFLQSRVHHSSCLHAAPQLQHAAARAKWSLIRLHILGGALPCSTHNTMDFFFFFFIQWGKTSSKKLRQFFISNLMTLFFRVNVCVKAIETYV